MDRQSMFAWLCLALGLTLLSMPRQSWAQAQKDPWVHGDEIQWSSAGALGPGTSIKVLLAKENGFIDTLIRSEYLVKIDAGGSYTANDTAKEDLAFYVTAGQAKVTLGTEQIDARPGDAFGVPAGTTHGIANNGKEPFEMVMFAAPVTAPNPANKPVWARADNMQWTASPTHGPGCELKMLLSGGFSSVIRALWTIRVGPYGINQVHTESQHQFSYIVDAPIPINPARDGRTAGGRLVVGNTVIQTRLGDAFYAAGTPKLVDHGMFNESKDHPLTYVAIGVPVGGVTAGSAGRGGARSTTAPAMRPGR